MATGVTCRIVTANIATDAGRVALIQASSAADILVTNNAGPPPGTIDSWDHDTWLEALEANMLSAVLLIRACLPGMRQRKFGRIVNITSAMVKSVEPEMGYRLPRARG